MIHWLIDSMTDSVIRWFIDSIQWFIEPLNHSFLYSKIGSLTHWFIDSLIRWFTASPTHWVVEPLNHGFVASLFHWSIEFIHRFIDSLVHRFIASLFHSCSCAVILSCHFNSISTTICSFVDAPYHFNTSLLLHRKSFPIGHWFPLVMSYFWNFRPGACRALPCIFNCLWMLMMGTCSHQPIKVWAEGKLGTTWGTDINKHQ